jgi:hypothetical protein
LRSFDDVAIESGADEKVRASVNRLVHLLGRENRPRTDQDVASTRHRRNDRETRFGSKGDLDARETSRHEGVRQRISVFFLVENDYGNDAQLAESLQRSHAFTLASTECITRTARLVAACSRCRCGTVVALRDFS